MSSTASKTDRPRQRSGEHHAILNTDGLKGGMLQHQLNPTPPTFQVKHQHRGLHKSKDSLVENPEYEKPKARKARQQKVMNNLVRTNHVSPTAVQKLQFQHKSFKKNVEKLPNSMVPLKYQSPRDRAAEKREQKAKRELYKTTQIEEIKSMDEIVAPRSKKALEDLEEFTAQPKIDCDLKPYQAKNYKKKFIKLRHDGFASLPRNRPKKDQSGTNDSLDTLPFLSNRIDTYQSNEQMFSTAEFVFDQKPSVYERYQESSKIYKVEERRREHQMHKYLDKLQQMKSVDDSPRKVKKSQAAPLLIKSPREDSFREDSVRYNTIEPDLPIIEQHTQDKFNLPTIQTKQRTRPVKVMFPRTTKASNNNSQLSHYQKTNFNMASGALKPTGLQVGVVPSKSSVLRRIVHGGTFQQHNKANSFNTIAAEPQPHHQHLTASHEVSPLPKASTQRSPYY